MEPTSDVGMDRRSEEIGNASDEALRGMLETLLSARRLNNGGASLDIEGPMVALSTAARLTREAVTWAAKTEGLLLSPEVYQSLPAHDRRWHIMYWLNYGLPIFQGEAARELVEGLFALNAGHAIPLLEKRKLGRRRIAPHDAATAELGILTWIRWQHGLGRKVADTEAQAAAAVGCTPTSFQRWRVELRKIFPSTFIGHRLDYAEEQGRLEAIGQTPELQSYIGNFYHSKLQDSFKDLEALVKMRRASIQKRRQPEL